MSFNVTHRKFKIILNSRIFRNLFFQLGMNIIKIGDLYLSKKRANPYYRYFLIKTNIHIFQKNLSKNLPWNQKM